MAEATKNKSSKKDTYSDTAFSRKALAKRSARTGKTVSVGDAVDPNDRGRGSSDPYAGMQQSLLGAQRQLDAYNSTRTIAVDDLNGTPANIPNFPKDGTDYNPLLGSLSGQAAGATDYLTALSAKQANDQNNLKSLFESLGAPTSQEKLYKQAQRETGILDKQNAVNDLSGQLNSITANAQANQLAVVGQGRGIPEAIIGGQQAQIGREAAIAALPVAAQLQAAQGNLEMAQQNLTQLFAIKSADANAKYAYKKDVLTAVYNLASTQEKEKLDYVAKIEDRKYQEQQAAQAEIKQLGLMALQNGAPASVLTSITSAKTYAEALKGAGSYGTNPLDQQLKRLQIAKAQQDLTPTSELDELLSVDEALKLGVPYGTTKGQAAGGKAGGDTSAVQALQDKVSAIDGLLQDKSYTKIVGTLGIGRTPLLSALTGKAQDASGTIKQLVSQETLDRLINLKKAGGTLGALSDQERLMLQNAATKIAGWEVIDDKGFGTGRYNASEGSFETELQTLKTLANRAIEQAGGSSAGNVDSYLNTVDAALQTVVNPYTQAGYLTY